MSKINQLRICVEKDIDINELEKLKNNKILRAAFLQNRKWNENTELFIYFMNKNPTISKTPLYMLEKKVDDDNNIIPLDPLQYDVYNNSIIDMIKIIIKERFEPIINIKFNFTDDPKKSQIRIDFDPDKGSWSYVGKGCLKKGYDEATMNFAWFDVPTVIHEFCHALGMIHEHQSTLGNSIQWDVEKLKKWAKDTYGWDEKQVMSQIVYKYDSTSLNGSDFDPFSIMLYYFPASVTLDNKGSRQNLRLSKYDTYFLNKIYPTDNTNAIQEFYKKVYDEELDPNNIKEYLTKYDNNNNEQTFLSKYFIYIIIISIVITLIIIIIFKVKK